MLVESPFWTDYRASVGRALQILRVLREAQLPGVQEVVAASAAAVALAVAKILQS